MKKNKNKLKKVILILLLILIIIFLGIKTIQANLEKEGMASKENYINNEEEVREYLNQRVIPRNIKALNKYQGNVNNDYLYKKLQELVNLFLDVNNNKDSLDKYYKEKENIIKELFGEINFQYFKDISNKISNNNFKYAEIIENSEMVLDNAFCIEICLNYENGNKINIKAYIQNEATNTQKDIIFEISN